MPELFTKPRTLPIGNKAGYGPLALNQLNEAIPRVITGDGLLVKKISDRWIIEKSDDYVYAPEEIQYMIVLEESYNYVQCILFSYSNSPQQFDTLTSQILDLEGLNSSIVYVAKPQTLQNVAWSGPTAQSQIPYIDEMPTTYESIAVNRRLLMPQILAGIVQNASDAHPISIRSLDHNLRTGMQITISGAKGNTAANGTWIVTVVDDNNFTLDDSTGNASYTGNGVWFVSNLPYAGRTPQMFQSISPPYLVGSIIAAKQASTGLTYVDPDNQIQSVNWIDVNDAGRVWQGNTSNQILVIDNSIPWLWDEKQTYDGYWELRDNDSQQWSQQTPVWIKDLDQAQTLTKGDHYDGTFIGYEIAGPYYLSLKDSNVDPLSDGASWLALIVDPTLDVEEYVPEQFYDRGSLVSYGEIYACTNPDGTVHTPGSSGDWEEVGTIEDIEEIDLTVPTDKWQTGRVKRLLYSINSSRPCNESSYKWTTNNLRGTQSQLPITVNAPDLSLTSPPPYTILRTYFPAYPRGNYTSDYVPGNPNIGISALNGTIHAIPFICPEPVRVMSITINELLNQTGNIGRVYLSLGVAAGVFPPFSPFWFQTYRPFSDNITPWSPMVWVAMSVVSYEGSYYFSLGGDTSLSPPSGSDFWQEFDLVDAGIYSQTTPYDLGQYVVAQPNPVIRMAIYEADSHYTPYPKKLIYQTPELSATYNSELLAKSCLITQNTNVLLRGGRLYWFCFMGDRIDTCRFDFVSGFGMPAVFGFGFPYDPSQNPFSEFSLSLYGIAAGYTYGPFPEIFPFTNKGIVGYYYDDVVVSPGVIAPFVTLGQV